MSDAAVRLGRRVAGPVLAWAAVPGLVWAGSAAVGHAVGAPVALAVTAAGLAGAGVAVRRSVRAIAALLASEAGRRSAADAAEVTALVERTANVWRGAGQTLADSAGLLRDARAALAAERAALAARGTARDEEYGRLVDQWLWFYQQLVAGTVDEVGELLAGIRRGRVPARPPFPALPADQYGRFGDVHRDLTLLGHTVRDSLAQAAAVNTDTAGAELQVFASFARRLHSAANRMMVELQGLENITENPAGLRMVLATDHRANLIRRDADSILVLAGGELPQHSGPGALGTVLRQANSETEHFSRVDIVAIAGVEVVPYLRPSLIHIIAALLENGTRFSGDNVEVGGTVTSAGLVISVVDRGLGMPPDDLLANNALLADPDPVVVRDRLTEGRIGLVVCAKLAARFGLSIVLFPCGERGTRAEVTVPAKLLLQPADEPPAMPAAQHTGLDAGGIRPVPRPTGPAPRPPVPAEVSPAPPPGGPLPEHRRASAPTEGGGTRPHLPRRRRSQPADTAAAVHTAPSDTGEIAPGLIGAFLAGTQEGAASTPSRGAVPDPERP
ncbi:ATP-binding protein [Actinacidiphila alni]|uniref:ATP-binding protein n=1 Tax=Actinacidiphila alni TaxID=380248 RepID=UPI0015A63393|nr:ATP-binding protein [Actinacidiphila alni]